MIQQTQNNSGYMTTVTRKVVSKALRRVRKYVAPLFSHDALTVAGLEEILQRNELGDLDWFVECQRHAPRLAPLLDFDLLRARFGERFESADEWIREKTDHALENRFSELGAGYVQLGDGALGLRWLEDFKSGISWPLEHYLRTEVVRDDDSDIKTVWELSRFQFGVNLAQREALSGDLEYRKHFIELVDDWQRKNPYPLGPNWNCAMEVAIRAINLLLAVEMFNRHAALPLTFVKSVYTLLYQSGKHIFANLENSGRGLNTNHYLANLIGLLTIGELFEALPEGAQWRNFAVRELEREILAQTTEEGFCYESSAAYHLLTLEFYLYAYTFARKNKIALSISYTRRLAKALEATDQLTLPNGRLPNIGDNDSGRLFKFSNREDLNPAWLMLWGRIEGLYTNADPKALRQSAESIWLFGFKEAPKPRNTITDTRDSANSATNSATGKSAKASRLLRKAGIAALRHDDLAMTVNVSNTGVNGVGGHKHNDQLALTFCWGNDELIIDPGMHCYTSDPNERNRLRSVLAHSTVAVDSEETNRFIPGFPFAVRRDGLVSTSVWMSTVELDLLKASHTCYSRMPGSPEVSRTVYFDKLARFFLIRDELAAQKISIAPDRQAMNSALILTGVPELEDDATANIVAGTDSDKSIAIRCYTPGATMESGEFKWAPGYGQLRRGSKLSIQAPPGVTEMIWGLFPNYNTERKQDSEALIFEKMRLLHWPTTDLRRWSSAAIRSARSNPEPVI